MEISTPSKTNGWGGAVDLPSLDDRVSALVDQAIDPDI